MISLSNSIPTQIPDLNPLDGIGRPYSSRGHGTCACLEEVVRTT